MVIYNRVESNRALIFPTRAAAELKDMSVVLKVVGCSAVYI